MTSAPGRIHELEHHTAEWATTRPVVCGTHGIGAVVTRRDPETGVLSAGADPRRTTYALAW